jgi:hypothetical protein
MYLQEEAGIANPLHCILDKQRAKHAANPADGLGKGGSNGTRQGGDEGSGNYMFSDEQHSRRTRDRTGNCAKAGELGVVGWLSLGMRNSGCR